MCYKTIYDSAGNRDGGIERDRAGNGASLRRAGAQVLAVGRDEAALAEVAATIASEGGQAAVLQADVTQGSAPERIVAAALDRFGGLTTLVNAAGIIGSGTIESTTDPEWDTMMDINARAPFRLMRAAVPALTASRGTDRQRIERDRPPGVPRRARVLRQQGGHRSADALRGARARAKRRACQRRQSRRRRFESSSSRRDGRGELRQVPHALARNPSARPAGRADRDCGLDFLPGVGRVRLDHR